MHLMYEIFEDVPDMIDESWTHGAILGGMAHGAYDQLAVADSYVRAGDTLVERVLQGGEGYELVYPILFTYRHAVELHLKIVLRPSRRTHKLNGLLADFCNYVQRVFQQQVPKWFTVVISEFATFDRDSMVFRYEDADVASEHLRTRGEFWVDLRTSRQKMERLQQGFHAVIHAAQQQRTTERGRATVACNSSATGRPRR
jgi:hypothetical protein